MNSVAYAAEKQERYQYSGEEYKKHVLYRRPQKTHDLCLNACVESKRYNTPIVPFFQVREEEET